MGSNLLAYATSTAVTITLNSLANAAARECTAIDNTANLYPDADLYLAIKLATGTPSGDKAIYVWFYSSVDGTNYTDNATGSDAAVTIRVPANIKGPFAVACPDAGALTYKVTIEGVARFFGGKLPRKWGFIVENRTGVAVDSSGNSAAYTGVYGTY